MDYNEMSPTQRKKAYEYFIGCHEYYLKKASQLEERLIKAESLGAHNPENQYYEKYIELKKEWNKAMDEAQQWLEHAEPLKPNEKSPFL
jgi:hypothetical protein